MRPKYVSVLDFGSSKITAMIGERGVNGTFNIRGESEVEYAGFMKGNFVEPEKLYDAIATCIVKVETNSGLKVTKLHIGVPAEFSFAVCKNASLAFPKKTKIKSKNVLELFELASKDVRASNATIISRSPIYFLLDDNRKVVSPENEVTTKLSAEVSFVLAYNTFIDTVDAIFKNMGLQEVEYISSPLAESLFALEPEVRDNGAILVDIGYLTTFVAYVKGDGILSLKEFSVGGGHVSADLCQVLQIPFSEAENLKRKVVLSLQATDSDCYEVTIAGNARTVSAKLTNEIVASRLDMISELAIRAITPMRSTSYVPIYLTGGGVCLVAGAKDYISKKFGENVEVVICNVPGMNKPNYCSVLGLLDLSLKERKEANKETLWEKIKSIFKK